MAQGGDWERQLPIVLPYLHAAVQDNRKYAPSELTLVLYQCSHDCYYQETNWSWTQKTIHANLLQKNSLILQSRGGIKRTGTEILN